MPLDFSFHSIEEPRQMYRDPFENNEDLFPSGTCHEDLATRYRFSVQI